MKSTMLDAVIVSREPIFARMLALELARYGYRAEYTATLPSSRDAKLIVADYDMLRQEERLRCEMPIGRRCYIIYADEKLPDSVGARRLIRPFLMTSFIQNVRELLAVDMQDEAIDKTLSFDKKPMLEITAAGYLFCGEPLILSPREADLLLYLYERRGEIVSREELYDHVWGAVRKRSNNCVDVYIGHLRRKIAKITNIRYITSIHGKGYRIEK